MSTTPFRDCAGAPIAASRTAQACKVNLTVSIMAQDFAVVGAGVFGAWTAWHLRQAGASVSLVETWGPGHSRASSGGESRIIRMGYGADEIYTRMAMRSLEMW